MVGGGEGGREGLAVVLVVVVMLGVLVFLVCNGGCGIGLVVVEMDILCCW